MKNFTGEWGQWTQSATSQYTDSELRRNQTVSLSASCWSRVHYSYIKILQPLSLLIILFRVLQGSPTGLVRHWIHVSLRWAQRFCSWWFPGEEHHVLVWRSPQAKGSPSSRCFSASHGYRQNVQAEGRGGGWGRGILFRLLFSGKTTLAPFENSEALG